jgi:hypothetical protein
MRRRNEALGGEEEGGEEDEDEEEELEKLSQATNSSPWKTEAKRPDNPDKRARDNNTTVTVTIDEINAVNSVHFDITMLSHQAVGTDAGAETSVFIKRLREARFGKPKLKLADRKKKRRKEIVDEGGDEKSMQQPAQWRPTQWAENRTCSRADRSKPRIPESVNKRPSG